MEMLKAKAEAADAEARIAAQRRIEAFEKQKEQVESKLSEMTNAAGKAYDDLRSGAESAFKELKASVESAIERMG
jgi:hypothetical protein